MTPNKTWFRASSVSLLGALIVVGCGGGESAGPQPSASSTGSVAASAPKTAPTASQAKPAPVVSSSPVASASAAAATAPFRFEQAILADAQTAAFVNVRALRDDGWLKDLHDIQQVADSLKDLETKCGMDPFAALDEVAMSAGESGTIAIAKLGAQKDLALTCAKGVASGEDSTFEGRKAVKLGRHMVAFVDGDLLVVGDERALVAAASNQTPPKPEFAKVLDKVDGRLLHVVGAGNGPSEGFELTLDQGKDVINLHATVVGKSEADAMEAEKQLQSAKESLGDDMPAEAKTFIKELKVKRDGKNVEISFEEKAEPAARAKLVGMVAATAIAGVRRYLSSAKAAEAKNTISAISRGLRAYVEACEKKPCLFPKSSPAVPKTIPKGNTFQSTPEDWAGSWKDAKFMITNPQHYQYHFDTSPDGKSCSVVAEGDLDGDGKTSKFTVSLKIGADGAVTADKQIKIENETE
ncbi:MAG: hypothetical protein U0271_36490 [Polyangiaceae bacterium]